MSTPDTQEKIQAPEKPSAGEAVVSKAENKASGEATAGKDSFYENITKQARALRKAREDGLRTGTHQEFGTPTIAGDDGKSVIKGGSPSKITLTEERLQELMKEPGRKLPDAAATIDQAFRDKGVQGSAEQTGTVIDYKPAQTSDKSFKLGMDYEDTPPDTRTPLDKLGDFMQAAAHRATDPEGWKAWTQGEINKFAGIGAGLNEAKDETKAAVAAGWKALTDGTVVEFLSQPNAINTPVFKTVANAFDAMSKDPEAVNHAFEALGKVVMKASEGYSNLPDYEKGKVIGKVMFGMVNPEGSPEGAEAALKVADQVATHVDKAVWDTIDMTVKSLKDMAPDVAENTKQMLFDYMKSKGLIGPELQYADVPKDFFDRLQEPAGGGKGDNVFAVSKEQEGSDLHMPEVPEHLKHLQLQPATQELIDAIVEKGVPIRFAQDAQDLAHLKSVHASAAYRMFVDGTHEIVLPPNPAKIQALEEFLHSTQNKLGFFEQDQIPRQIAEVHVKDFMIRHARLLGLNDNDIQVLQSLKQRAIEKANAAGLIWKE